MSRTAKVNLMPRRHRDRLSQQIKIRRWKRIVAAYAGLMGMACAGVWALQAQPSAAAAKPAASTQALRAQDKQALTVALETEVAAYKLTQQRADFVREQPDFGVLLELLARKSQGRAMLTRLDLKPENIDGQPSAYRLELDGLAQSPREAAGFVLALEDTGVFASVRLLGTARAQEFGLALTSFRLDCELAPEPGGRP